MSSLFYCLKVLISAIFEKRLTDPRTDPRTDGWTDKASYRDAWTHLKTDISTASLWMHYLFHALKQGDGGASGEENGTETPRAPVCQEEAGWEMVNHDDYPGTLIRSPRSPPAPLGNDKGGRFDRVGRLGRS